MRRADTASGILAAIIPAEELRNLEKAALLGAKTVMLVAEPRADRSAGCAESKPESCQRRNSRGGGRNSLLRVLREALLAAMTSVRFWAEATAPSANGRSFLICMMTDGWFCVREN